MKYAVLTSKGKIYTFFILAVAETYQRAYGGQIITLDGMGLSRKLLTEIAE